jgi:hypothetical protein
VLVKMSVQVSVPSLPMRADRCPSANRTQSDGDNQNRRNPMPERHRVTICPIKVEMKNPLPKQGV